MPVPSYATVLDALRHARSPQVMRYRHTPVFDALVELNFIVWVRQPVRLTQQVSERTRLVPVPVEVAELTSAGHIVLDWLATLEGTSWWESLRVRPYRARGTQEHA
ncbi:hypothetical protein [Burkholderia cepacia]|uniref:hypothetical protein n=1 Tax=Burkholderia cepacia TaxID=292 RepID=UPI0012D87300|nr:hypothetical protein [Burkholderia cepacia]